MSGHDPRFDQLDGAYVLGSLSADERREYEDHLSGCGRCRAQVAELTALPGLLGRLPTSRALDLLPTGAIAGSELTAEADSLTPTELAPPADLARRLQRRAGRTRLRARMTAVGAALVAAAVAVVVVLGIQSIRPAPTVTAELAPTTALGSPADLTASVKLYRRAWGTEVDTECRHKVTAAGEYSQLQYGLYVIGSDGSESLVSSWRGIAKSQIDTVAATATPIDRMSRLELRSIDDDRLLLAAPVHG